ncbi:30S ribosome-binding factor RbfA [bacterium]|nr:30S ribosome-binding factor RbfA [bacterium]
MNTRRQNRINSLLHRAIGEIIERGLRKDFPGLITITRVKISPDLSAAHVYYSVLGGDEDHAGRVLLYSRKYILTALAKNVRLRILPKLIFAVDEDLKQANRIDDLIREIRKDED